LYFFLTVSLFQGNIKSYEEAFSARYKAAYMWFLVQSIEKEIEGKTTPHNWQLPQRKVIVLFQS